MIHDARCDMSLDICVSGRFAANNLMVVVVVAYGLAEGALSIDRY